MDLSLDILDIGSIHFLCTKVADIPDDRFRFYVELLRSKMSIIWLEGINLIPERNPQLSVFVHREWNEGFVRINYHTDITFQKNTVLQRFKQFSGVIGIAEGCAAPLNHYETFTNLADSLENLLIQRMFVFEPNQDDYNFEASAPNMIPFYPNQTLDRLEHHIETVIQDMTSFLICEIAREINTPTDSIITLGNENESEARLVRKKGGRQAKIYGDLMLMSGSTNDAVILLNRGIEMQKSMNDSIWLASSFETQACAQIFKEISASGNFVYNEAIANQLKEATALYQKARDNRLYIESTFRYARYLLKTDLKKDGIDILTKVVEKAPTLISLPEQIELFRSYAIEFKNAGYMRKYAFFTRHAAKISEDCKDFALAEKLHLDVAHIYHLPQLNGTTRTLQRSETRRGWNEEGYVRLEQMGAWYQHKQTWLVMQQQILEELYALAIKLHDSMAITKYALELLDV